MNTENPLYFTIKPISFPLPTPIFLFIHFLDWWCHYAHYKYVEYDMSIVTLDLRKTIAVILLTSSDVGWVIHSVFDIGKIFIQ